MQKVYIYIRCVESKISITHVKFIKTGKFTFIYYTLYELLRLNFYDKSQLLQINITKILSLWLFILWFNSVLRSTHYINSHGYSCRHVIFYQYICYKRIHEYLFSYIGRKEKKQGSMFPSTMNSKIGWDVKYVVVWRQEQHMWIIISVKT